MTRAELRSVQLQILDALHAFCVGHGIRHSLTAGSLLGAVRHGGYIPWDDDIDLMMPRPDYERFLAEVVAESIGPRIVVGSTRNLVNWPFPYAKVMRVDTRLVEKSELRVELGVNVDVFPIDGSPPRPMLRRAHWCLLAALKWVMAAQALSRSEDRSTLKRTMLRTIKPVLDRIPRASLVELRTRIGKSVEIAHSSRVGIYMGEVFWATDRRSVEQVTMAPFEGRSMPVPADADAVLRDIYGDYMTPPPTEGRVTHHAFSAYWRSGPSPEPSASGEGCS